MYTLLNAKESFHQEDSILHEEKSFKHWIGMTTDISY